MPQRTTQANEASDLPPDIRARVVEDFGPAQADAIYGYLLERIPDGLPNGTRPRHLRCILYLAKGDRTLLDRYIEMCLEDTRDVMLNAEYETGPRLGLTRKRNFGKPFAQSELRSGKSRKKQRPDSGSP